MFRSGSALISLGAVVAFVACARALQLWIGDPAAG